jgi:V8-like Glu-specific endopeptidase
MTFLTRVSISASALLMLSTSVSYAQDKSVILVNPDAKAATSYWTPERFKAARPLPMPQATPNAVLPQEQPRADVQVQSSNAHAPALNVRPAAKTLFTPDAAQHQDSVVASPHAVGTFGAHYTSTRVFPLFTGTSAGFSADRAYPYITVGKLFFSIGGTPYVCSASVIQHRIVATAGHCVHSGTTGGFYSNWVFVPAFRDGTAPLLSWNWRSVIVTGAWAGGGGAVPNAADYAMIEFADQPVGNSRAVALGDLTGWLGWQTLSLAANHTSKLGYPCNLDSCQKMQDVTSSALRTVAPNNVEYGSDATGGSSGGPWVQNFQVTQVGGGTGLNTGSNRVVGVTSYGYVSADPKVQGASIPDSRWVDLFNTLCARVAGNCL